MDYFANSSWNLLRVIHACFYDPACDFQHPTLGRAFEVLSVAREALEEMAVQEFMPFRAKSVDPREAPSKISNFTLQSFANFAVPVQQEIRASNS